jgi:CRISPR-associated protein Csc3
MTAMSTAAKIQKEWLLQQHDSEDSSEHCITHSTQNVLVYILNSLLATWNLLPLVESTSTPSDDEKRLLCLGITLHCLYREWFRGIETLSIEQKDTIFEQFKMTGQQLNFDGFWSDWHDYLSEIIYLAQATCSNFEGTTASNESVDFKIPSNYLDHLLCPLRTFGTTAAQLTAPTDIAIKAEGTLLQKQLKLLGIKRQLTYHQVRACIGLLTQSIHNTVIKFVKTLDWQPILFFAQGVVYLTPPNTEVPDRAQLQKFLWECISNQLADSMLRGEVGFKQDGKGVKASPQALELFTPTQLIRHLPKIIASCVKNEKDPASPKRLAKLNLDQKEHEFLKQGADIRADRIAEFIILIQRKYFANCPEFVIWVLEKLELESEITPEHTRRYAGGVNLGWYHAAAYYMSKNPIHDSLVMLQDLAEQLANWTEDKNLHLTHQNTSWRVFYDYIERYLEFQGWKVQGTSFQEELAGYVHARERLAAKQPICSLSSGEFPSEDQLDSVVLFKPQQYSNKNPLGGRQIKRGISKIWSLEMLLRQAAWAAPAGKLDEQQPVFLYTYPATLQSPQLARVLQQLLKGIKHVNLWKIRKYWLANGMDTQSLRSFPWLELVQQNSGSSSETDDSEDELPFVTLTHATTKNKTVADAWVKPIFLTLALPVLLGVKVAATNSSVPPYNSGSEFQGIVKLDGTVDFWHLLQLPDTLHHQNWMGDRRTQSLVEVLNRVLVSYSLHLDTRSDPPDAHWGALNGTVRDVVTDILNIFLLAKGGLRRNNAKQELTAEDVQRYWHYAQIWAEGDAVMQAKLKVTKQLVNEYRKFYRASAQESSHTILLPLSKALKHILSVPADWDDEEIIEQGAGMLKDALDRQEIYKRPLLLDKSIDYEVRQLQEIEAIQVFMTTCVKRVFGEMCKGDRALLQEQCNRIKAEVEFAYRQFALQEKQAKANQKQGGEREYS